MSSEENGTNEGTNSESRNNLMVAQSKLPDSKSCTPQEAASADAGPTQMDEVSTSENYGNTITSNTTEAAESNTIMRETNNLDVSAVGSSTNQNNEPSNTTSTSVVTQDVTTTSNSSYEEGIRSVESRDSADSPSDTVLADSPLPSTDATAPACSTAFATVDLLQKDIIESAAASLPDSSPSVTFKAVFNGKKHDVTLPLSSTVSDLKKHLSTVIEVPPSLQKVMIKGLAPDAKTLGELGVTRTSKVLVVGSKFDEVIGVNIDKTPSTRGSSSSPPAAAASTDPLCLQPVHKKILDKGLPDDAHPGIRSRKDPLPPHPISGMVNKQGGKVRLTFKLELDQVWIGTKQRTEKVNMNSVRSIVSQPIRGKEEYHIMGLQLGTTEASRYWLYWVPAQYVDAIKATVLGNSVW